MCRCMCVSACAPRHSAARVYAGRNGSGESENNVCQVLVLGREQPHGEDWGKKGGGLWRGGGRAGAPRPRMSGMLRLFLGRGVMEIPPCIRGVRLPGGRGAGEQGAWDAPGNIRCPAGPGVAGGGVFWRG